jgi:hypothetical protein
MSKEIDIGDNVFWALVWLIVGVVTLAIAWLIHDYNLKSNEQIKNADTCEKAVLLQGGNDVSNRLIGCKIKFQEAVTGK